MRQDQRDVPIRLMTTVMLVMVAYAVAPIIIAAIPDVVKSMYQSIIYQKHAYLTIEFSTAGSIRKKIDRCPVWHPSLSKRKRIQ